MTALREELVHSYVAYFHRHSKSDCDGRVGRSIGNQQWYVALIDGLDGYDGKEVSANYCKLLLSESVDDFGLDEF